MELCEIRLLVSSECLKDPLRYFPEHCREQKFTGFNRDGILWIFFPQKPQIVSINAPFSVLHP